MSHLKLVKPNTAAEKTTRTTTSAEEVTPNIVRSWKKPSFQRPLTVTKKVETLAEEISNEGVIPGIITLGVYNGDRYVIDGQHRVEAYLMSGIPVAYVDVRVAHYKTMEDMGREYRKLNSSLVKMKPDDHLRAMEGDSEMPSIASLRKMCPFVGYDNIKRGPNTPLLSMGTVIRCWDMSGKEAPISGGGVAAGGVVEVAKRLTEADAKNLASFLNTAYEAWGNDKEYHHLWNNLNMMTCMWLYRRLVLVPYSSKSVRISSTLFQKCLSALSANDRYLEWLHGRNGNGPHRAPGYKRVKDIFAKRISEEQGKKPNLPSPSWGK